MAQLLVTFYFQCYEKEAEILSLSAKIEVLKLQNNELDSEEPNQKTKIQVSQTKQMDKIQAI